MKKASTPPFRMAATLLLSGSVLANPADVSGVSNPQTSTDDSYSAEAIWPTNMYSALQKQLYSAEMAGTRNLKTNFMMHCLIELDEMISSEMSYYYFKFNSRTIFMALHRAFFILFMRGSQ